jgi:hypothetical protein
MRFASRLKGGITQTLLRTLLQDCGYRIVPLGIEEVIREVSVLPREDYRNLALPQVLRSMPDFFVAQEDMKKTWLVEVKYRKTWDDTVRAELGEEIAQQVKDWGPLHLIVFLGSPAKERTDLPSSWFGVLRLQWHDGVLVALGTDDKPYASWSEIVWKDFFRVQELFTTLSEKKQFKEKTLFQVCTMLPQLAALQVFE